MQHGHAYAEAFFFRHRLYRARVLGEHDHAIRAAVARMTTLLTSDTQIATVLSAQGIQLQTGLSH
jgi:hypothetical protein